MSPNERESNKRPDQRLAHYLSTYTGGYRIVVALCILGGIIAFLITLNGYSETWAWEIAKTIISIDGILLGFTIVGITLFFSERGYAMTRMSEIFEKHFKEFLTELKVVEQVESEKAWKRLEVCVESAMFESLAVPSPAQLSIFFLSISVGFALALFGVRDANSPTLKTIFDTILGISIDTLLLGIYLTYRFIDDFIRSASGSEMRSALKEAIDVFKKKTDRKTGSSVK